MNLVFWAIDLNILWYTRCEVTNRPGPEYCVLILSWNGKISSQINQQNSGFLQQRPDLRSFERPRWRQLPQHPLWKKSQSMTEFSCPMIYECSTIVWPELTWLLLDRNLSERSPECISLAEPTLEPEESFSSWCPVRMATEEPRKSPVRWRETIITRLSSSSCQFQGNEYVISISPSFRATLPICRISRTERTIH